MFAVLVADKADQRQNDDRGEGLEHGWVPFWGWVGLVDDGLAGAFVGAQLIIIRQPLNFNLPRKKMTKGY